MVVYRSTAQPGASWKSWGTVEYRMNGQTYEEPWIMATIIVPQNYLGGVITLCEDRRAKLIDMNYHGSNVTVTYEIPLSEIITDFFDQLKSNSSGFASMDYEFLEYRPFNAVNLEILINHEAIDAFSQIMEKDRAEKFGKFLVERLKDVIPRQQIAVPIQAVINGQVIARADISSFRKDVIAKLYGGDVTRKMKLLEKQKEGKKKMKTIGKVEIPNDTFLKVFRT
jgi:GTP-binding protein LepA